jgi:hypothetical protein
LASEPGVTKGNYQTKPAGDRRTGIGSPHSEGNLTNYTTYYLVVTALNAAGESAESAEVSATPIPLGGEFTPTQDVTLAGGAYDFSAMTIPAGVAVMVMGDVTITVSGDTVIAGSLTGDCRGIELRGAGAFTLDGFVGNPCTDGAQEPADLTLVFGGAVTIGSTVADELALDSDGFLTLSDTATEGISLEPIDEANGVTAQAAITPAQAGGGMVLNRPIRGKRGASVHSEKDVALNATVTARDGQDAPMLRALNCDNSGGIGGAGGSVYLASRSGVLTINGTLQAGRGGAGGACVADADGTGMAAAATGGRGGRGGGVYLGARGNTFGLGFGAGDGGDGGNGNPVGLGGAPGIATGDPDAVDEGKPGADGELCPLQGARRFLDLNGLPQGELEPGSYALAVLAGDRETPTGETVAAVVRSDGATYLKEGQLLFVGADGGLEFDLKSLSSVRSFRATVNPAACGEMEAGAVQLRGLVANEVVIARVAETGSGEVVLQLDHAAGLDDVYLESLAAPLCLDAFAIELGLEQDDVPDGTLAAWVDFSVIPEGEIADDSSYCLPLRHVATHAVIGDYAVLAVFDWDFESAGAVRVAPGAIGPQSFSGSGVIQFIGQISLELRSADCPSPQAPLQSLLATYATVTSFGPPGSTWLRGYRGDEVVVSTSNSKQNMAERLSINLATPFDKVTLATDALGTFPLGTGIEIRFIPPF